MSWGVYLLVGFVLMLINKRWALLWSIGVGIYWGLSRSF